MAKLISAHQKRLGNGGNPFTKLWKWFHAQDRFTKFSILGVLAIMLATPLGVLEYQTFFENAQVPLTPPLTPPNQQNPFNQSIIFAATGNTNAFVTVDQPLPMPSNPFTVEAWVKVPPVGNAGTGSTDYKLITASKTPTASANGFNYQLTLHQRYNDGFAQPNFTILIANNTNIGNNMLTVGGGQIYLMQNTWNHIAVTSYTENGACKLQMFINGILADSIQRNYPNCQVSIDQPSTLYFGYPYENNTGYSQFTGQMDEVRISNTVRYTSNFVMSGQPFSLDGNTISLWHFDGNTLDAAGNNNGTSIGTTEYADSDVLTPQATNMVTGYAYLDSNGNGVKDQNESDYPGQVTITVFNLSGSYHRDLNPYVNGFTGLYEDAGIPPGSYKVFATLSTGKISAWRDITVGTSCSTTKPTSYCDTNGNIQNLNFGVDNNGLFVEPDSVTPTTMPTNIISPTATQKVCDFNGDSKIDLTDFSIFAINYGRKAPNLSNAKTDINGDGKVDLTDFSLFAAKYGQ